MKGAPRKLRKSCSLTTCSKTPGECMHCTCDGRCGQHVGGRCGVRREGNGKSCKREGCTKDEMCLHSTRATCCHCRNLVSSSNRSSRKRKRADVGSEMESKGLMVALLNAKPFKAEMMKAENENDERDGEEDEDQVNILVNQDVEEEDQEEEEVEEELLKLYPTTHTSDYLENKIKNKNINDDVDDDGATSPTSCDALLPLSADIFLDFEICEELLVVTKKPRTELLTMDDLDELQDVKLLLHEFRSIKSEQSLPEQEQESASTVATTTKSLSEYEQYAVRRASCNLVVVVECTQFNLHKHPMLLESQLLNAKARESVLTTQSPVPLVQLPFFPGGTAAFEALCVYAYTGELPLCVETIASLFCGVQFLNMGFAAATATRDFLTSLLTAATTASTDQARSLTALLHVTMDAQRLMTTHDSLLVCQQLQLECVDALARALPLELGAVRQLLTLPMELFLQVTQEMLATRGPRELAMDTVRQLCVQAELAQLHRVAMETNQSQSLPKADTVKVANAQMDDTVQQCLSLLQQSLLPTSSCDGFQTDGRLCSVDGNTTTTTNSTNSSNTNNVDDDDALFLRMVDEFELDSDAGDDAMAIGDGPVVHTSGGAFTMDAFEPFAFASARRDHRLLANAFAV